MDDTTRHVLRLRKAMEAVKQLMPEPTGTTEIEVAIPASATSASNLGLSGTGTPTTLQSTEEVNTAPTSYSTHGPEWAGASTVQTTISGEYDGSNGTDPLTFEVTRGGTHGSANLQIKVYDSNNIEIDKIDIKRNDSVDKQYTSNNGLVLTFSAGDLVKNDTFTMEVYDSIGTAVDPDKPFNGTRNDDPDLQSGLGVTSGSFQVNAVSIDVQENDTINTVLDKINQSDAGVTATFDAASETLLLTQDTPGSTQDIVLENDTSGFLAAVKLDGAVAIPGEDAESGNPLAEVESFSSVQSGTLSVNGGSFDIDVNTDSLTDVLDRITASEAEVAASFDSASLRVSLNSNDSDSQLILDSGTTNFFSAVEISDGTYDPVNESIEVQTEGVDVVNESDLVAEYAETYNSELASTVRADQEVTATPVTSADAKILGKLVDIIADSMNALFDGSAFTSSSATKTEGVRNDTRSAISAWFDSEGPQFNTDFGIGFDFEKTKEGVFKFS